MSDSNAAALLHSAYRNQLEYLDAVCTAVERSAELLDLVELSADRDEATQSLMRAFGVSEMQAVAMLDVQVSRFTAQGRARLLLERDQIRALLAG
jgi:DNA gyrase/topoisomerase IV subunit A